MKTATYRDKQGHPCSRQQVVVTDPGLVVIAKQLQRDIDN